MDLTAAILSHLQGDGRLSICRRFASTDWLITRLQDEYETDFRISMTIPEVLDIFEEHTRKENIPLRFIDLEHLCLVDIDAIRDAYRDSIDSIQEADIERHTSYANQRREDVIRTIVKGVVKYAILSHTWFPSDQHLYDDMVSDVPRNGSGWHKLVQFCDIAKSSFRCRFAWADLGCINFEDRWDREAATQSLFDWYRNAYICIAHLAMASGTSDMDDDAWFYRGFTLTELLAPTRMKFYGAGWKPLNNDYLENDKADGVFLELLSKASGVPADDLRTFWPGPDRIRHKLSWASRRNTKRVEDKAYSLMAMFDSRIPVNYGEGEMAFTRLMMDVIPRSEECDVFAWAGPCSKHHPGLPPSPAGFGAKRLGRQLNSDPHHYRLCGDRSLSIDPDHLRIRVTILETSLPPRGTKSYTPVPLGHPASISEVSLLQPQRLTSKAVADRWMAVGVIDYGWTAGPDEGILHEGTRYFGFLLYKNSPSEAWRKVLTEKVVFLVNHRKFERKLELLCI